MSDYTWSDLRAEAITKFGGQTPGAPLEQRIIDVFTRHPALVSRSIDKIAAKYHAGTVRNPWPVLAIDVEDAATPNTDIHATDSTDREKATMRAEQWMRTAGMHYDRWDEVEDELFGDRGPLRAWNTDQALIDRMRAAWQQAHTIGEQIEADELERAAKYVNDRSHARAATTPGTLRLALAAPEPVVGRQRAHNTPPD